MSLPHEGNTPRTSARKDGIMTRAHSFHLFDFDGRPIEVDVCEIDEADWAALGGSVGPRCSTTPIGGGRLRVVRLTI